MHALIQSGRVRIDYSLWDRYFFTTIVTPALATVKKLGFVCYENSFAWHYRNSHGLIVLELATKAPIKFPENVRFLKSLKQMVFNSSNQPSAREAAAVKIVN